MTEHSSSIRLNANLVSSAAIVAKSANRSCAQQIEFWAELGKKLSGHLTEQEAVKFLSGQTNVVMKVQTTYSFDAKALAKTVQNDEALSDDLLNNGHTLYSASPNGSDLLIASFPDGTVKEGHFKNGEFKQLRKQNVE